MDLLSESQISCFKRQGEATIQYCEAINQTNTPWYSQRGHAQKPWEPQICGSSEIQTHYGSKGQKIGE